MVQPTDVQTHTAHLRTVAVVDDARGENNNLHNAVIMSDAVPVFRRTPPPPSTTTTTTTTRDNDTPDRIRLHGADASADGVALLDTARNSTNDDNDDDASQQPPPPFISVVNTPHPALHAAASAPTDATQTPSERPPSNEQQATLHPHPLRQRFMSAPSSVPAALPAFQPASDNDMESARQQHSPSPPPGQSHNDVPGAAATTISRTGSVAKDRFTRSTQKLIALTRFTLLRQHSSPADNAATATAGGTSAATVDSAGAVNTSGTIETSSLSSTPTSRRLGVVAQQNMAAISCPLPEGPGVPDGSQEYSDTSREKLPSGSSIITSKETHTASPSEHSELNALSSVMSTLYRRRQSGGVQSVLKMTTSESDQGAGNRRLSTISTSANIRRGSSTMSTHGPVSPLSMTGNGFGDTIAEVDAAQSSQPGPFLSDISEQSPSGSLYTTNAPAAPPPEEARPKSAPLPGPIDTQAVEQVQQRAATLPIKSQPALAKVDSVDLAGGQPPSTSSLAGTLASSKPKPFMQSLNRMTLNQRLFGNSRQSDVLGAGIMSSPILPSQTNLDQLQQQHQHQQNCACTDKSTCPHDDPLSTSHVSAAIITPQPRLHLLTRDPSQLSHFSSTTEMRTMHGRSPPAQSVRSGKGSEFIAGRLHHHPLLHHPQQQQQQPQSQQSSMLKTSSKSLKIGAASLNMKTSADGPSSLIKSSSFLVSAGFRADGFDGRASRMSLPLSGGDILGSGNISLATKSLEPSIPSLYPRDNQSARALPHIQPSATPSESDLRMGSQITLRFKKDLEELYQVYYSHQNKSMFKLLLIVLLGVNTSLFVWNLYMQEHQNLTLYGPVIGMLVTGAVAVRTFLGISDGAIIAQSTLVGVTLGGSVLWNNLLRQYCVLHRYWDNVLHLNFIIFLGTNYWLLRVPLRHRINIGWAFTGVQILVDLLGQCQMSRTVAAGAMYMATNVLGMFFAYISETNNRQAFLKTRIVYRNQGKLQLARQQSEALLKMVLPMKLIEELKNNASSVRNNTVMTGKDPFAELDQVTIMFADIVGFTEFSSKVSAKKLVNVLSELFSAIDNEAEALGLEKIKTIGDCYQCCGGLPDPVKNEAEAVSYAEKMVHFGLVITRIVDQTSRRINYPLRVRVGIHTGSVIAGIVGVSKLKYDVWSSNVDIASLMEQSATPDIPHISETTYALLKDNKSFQFTAGKDVECSDQMLKTYNVAERRTVARRIGESGLPTTSSRLFGAQTRPISSDLSEQATTDRADRQAAIFDPIDNRAEVLFDDVKAPEKSLEAQSQLFAQFQERVNIFGTFKDAEFEEEYKNDYLEHHGHNLVTSLCVVIGLPVIILLIAVIQGDSSLEARLPLLLALVMLVTMTWITHRQFELKREQTAQSPLNNVSHHSLWMNQERRPVSLDSIVKFGKWHAWQPNLQVMVALAALVEAYLAQMLWKATPQASYSAACMTLFMFSCTLFVGLKMRYFTALALFSLALFDFMFMYQLYLVLQQWPPLTTDVVQMQLILVIAFLIVALANAGNDRLMRQNFQMKRYIEGKSQEIKLFQKDTERLLLNIFPLDVALRLRANPTHIIADAFEDVSIMFFYITNFYSLDLSPTMSLKLLNELISEIDDLCESCGIEKIKTIGTKYLAMAKDEMQKKPFAQPHYMRMADFAIRLRTVISNHNEQFFLMFFQNISIRIGLNCGPVVAGVIGTTKFSYDVWGDTVNVASRMESNGLDSSIHVSEVTYNKLKHAYDFEARGQVYIKGKGNMNTFFLLGPKATTAVVSPVPNALPAAMSVDSNASSDASPTAAMRPSSPMDARPGRTAMLSTSAPPSPSAYSPSPNELID
ncbi:hypothetical protein RI367_008220 [Sorochytrium milnesiophthora]